MRKFLILIAVLKICNYSFCQDIRMVIPTFYKSSVDLSNQAKLADLEYKSNDNILKNINYEGLENNFKFQDTIVFEINFIVGKSGNILKEATNVSSKSDFLNSEFVKAINNFPNFTPAISLVKKVPVDYKFKTVSKFYFSPDLSLLSISNKNSFKTLPLFGKCNKVVTLESQKACLIDEFIDYLSRNYYHTNSTPLNGNMHFLLKVRNNGIIELQDMFGVSDKVKEKFRKVVERLPKAQPATNFENEPIEFILKFGVNFIY